MESNLDRNLTIEEMLTLYRMMRGIEDPCERCHGTGVRVYSNTATWRGGIGGNMFTSGVCDKCWGSGDKHKPWLDLRTLESREAEIRRTSTLTDWFGPATSGSESVPIVRRCVQLLRKECRKRNVTFWEDMHIRALANALNRLLPEAEREPVDK